MAANASAAWYSNHERRGAVAGPRNTHQHQQQSTMPMTANGTTTYLPSIFPDNFKDFFAALNEDADDPLMEDKLLPRRDDAISNNNNINKQRWAKRAFQRRSSEIEVRPRHYNEGQNQSGYDRDGGRKSPTPSRRRSSSIAVARLTPDLHRFLQTEGSKPWGHLDPKAHSPTALSPGGISTGAGASPSGPSPTNSGPANLSSSRLSFQIRPRGRTSSMPAVPRHRPMLVETRRQGNPASPGNGPDDPEGHYYRVRSFSISANGCIENLGDLLKSKSINSVTSSSTSSVNRDRLLSSSSQLSNYDASAENNGCAQQVPKYKVGIIGASNTGKTSISCQLCTSEYVSAFSNSLGASVPVLDRLGRARRIVGGAPIEIEEYPWLVSIQKDGYHTCAGSVISKSIILTAAHCCTKYPLDSLLVRVGSSRTDSGGWWHRVVAARPHEKHTRTTGYIRASNDVALMKLTPVLRLDDNVATIRLAEEGAVPPLPGTPVTIAGWGSLVDGGSATPLLRSTYLRVVDSDSCARLYGDTTGTQMGSSHLVCATAGGTGVCKGDSGGPLVDQRGVQIGILSWGYGCANPRFPGVYANVAYYREWIRNNTQILETSKYPEEPKLPMYSTYPDFINPLPMEPFYIQTLPLF